jgi:hypothetical protein
VQKRRLWIHSNLLQPSNRSAHCLGSVVLKLRDQWVPIEREKLPPRPYNLVRRALGALERDRTYNSYGADAHRDRRSLEGVPASWERRFLTLSLIWFIRMSLYECKTSFIVEVEIWRSANGYYRKNTLARLWY